MFGQRQQKPREEAACPKSQRTCRGGEGVYENQALDLWTFDSMTLAPWNGQGRCPISPEGSGPGRGWFLPRDKVRPHFRGHSSGFASEQPPVRCRSPVFLHPRALPRAAAAALILFPKPNVQPQPPSTPEDASGRGVCGGAGTERRNQPSRSPRAAVKAWFCSRDWAGRRAGNVK